MAKIDKANHSATKDEAIDVEDESLALARMLQAEEDAKSEESEVRWPGFDYVGDDGDTLYSLLSLQSLQLRRRRARFALLLQLRPSMILLRTRSSLSRTICRCYEVEGSAASVGRR